jgi:hypothetical protein
MQSVKVPLLPLPVKKEFLILNFNRCGRAANVADIFPIPPQSENDPANRRCSVNKHVVWCDEAQSENNESASACRKNMPSVPMSWSSESIKFA